ncbi:glycosyltransferase [Candidatus Saccharibacteria bacterium]|nr:MAG: glycosyltransferase [Candidatus Saccharibacteria bacterium]
MKNNVAKKVLALITSLSPTLTSRLLFLFKMRRWLHLRNPVWYSEKLMKLKLVDYSSNPNVWLCTDKLTMRQYVIDKGVSEDHLPKLLARYENANMIDFDKLPEKFVLKCTHGAGFNVICSNKQSLDFNDVKLKLEKWLSTPYGLDTAETQYNRIKPLIICEEFVDNNTGTLPIDYKVYCFGGVPRYVMACIEREGKYSKVKIFDTKWRPTDYIKPQYTFNTQLGKPKTLASMLQLASQLSSSFPFVRVDFYEHRGRAVIGEMTFTPHACLNTDMTNEAQLKLGALIDLCYSPTETSL